MGMTSRRTAQPASLHPAAHCAHATNQPVENACHDRAVVTHIGARTAPAPPAAQRSVNSVGVADALTNYVNSVGVADALTN